ncbi:MAG TPA: class I SAM-dependent methyltransferase [Bacillales bacterium]|nr:class I SAM-dependent methyltransferase [Bacillales bacterium]
MTRLGREFVNLFDHWAENYDETVNGKDNEYHEVFEDYDLILTKVTELAKGTVLEFGVGTGNLTDKLLQAGLYVYGVEPSTAMREKAKARFPELEVADGDFLQYPAFEKTIETIVSTYAFHHLTDEEKRLAIRKYGDFLPSGGKIVFADTVFADESAKADLFERVRKQEYENLLHDLQTEFYTFKNVLEQIFTQSGFDVSFMQLNRYVWLIDAVKR